MTRTTFCRSLLPLSATAITLSASSVTATPPPPLARPITSERCAALASEISAGMPVNAPTITAATWHEAATTTDQRGAKTAPQPAHCEVTGHYASHSGAVGGPYRTGFRMRLPAQWNDRFFFQGGGGSNGVVGDALGANGLGNRTALERGYAVIAQDSGHDNATNKLASHGGDLVFGHDPVARANYGHASLMHSYDLGRRIIQIAYGQSPRTNIFWGCSKGGQEGMAFAQRYPQAFDGIVAMAPGMSLPRAALAEAWDSQQFATILRTRGTQPGLAALKTAITADQYKLVGAAVQEGCDGLDGAKDGIIGAVGQCTARRVLPELRKRQCQAGQTSPCLAPEQITALDRVMGGVRNSKGQALYAAFPWDSGIAEPGWRVWKTGLENGPPALNALLGAGSLAAVFTSPPTPLAQGGEAALSWQLAFDFDRDTPKINAIAAPFTTSAWQDIGMRSTDLSAFAAHGGKLMVPHGVSDPVFSVYDTIDWWQAVNRRARGQASRFARVFPVPGMNHCGGGPATDQFDSLTALENWVISGQSPDSLAATAGPSTPWPGRQRPLCAWPKMAVPAGESFICKAAPAKK